MSKIFEGIPFVGWFLIGIGLLFTAILIYQNYRNKRK